MAFCKLAGNDAVDAIEQSSATLIIARYDVAEQVDPSRTQSAIVGVANPRLGFIQAAQAFFSARNATGSRQAETCAIDPTVRLGRNVRTGQFAVLESECTVGDNCDIGPHVVIHAGCELGQSVVIQAGAIIGADGFGFERDERSVLHRFPHQGVVRIGPDVEIGARACIDRGALSDTVIGKGTKIDDGAYIAHNAQIGQNCLIMANAILCGSCIIGDDVEISPGAVIRDGITVGDGARVGLGAVVVSNVSAGTCVAGVPARPFVRTPSKPS